MLSVKALPPLGDALVVDSFAVVEYRESCAWDCPYLVYAPLLRLREPTGKVHADAVGVTVTIADATIGPCSGEFRVEPGVSQHVNPIHWYLWANELVLVRLDGVPLTADSASARVIVRDAHGRLSRIEARGPILRPTTKPVLPSSEGGIEYWWC